MHSHDRTLISKLGFDDQDRKQPMHELACSFLGQPKIVDRIARAFLKSDMKDKSWTEDASGERGNFMYCNHPYKEKGSNSRYINGAYVSYEVELDRHCCERLRYTHRTRFDHFRLRKVISELPISKGEGKYATIVGFIDAVLIVVPVHGWGDVSGFYDQCPKGDHDRRLATFERKPKHELEPRTIAIEVKIEKVQPSELIRQVKLYREFFMADLWVFASPWLLNDHEKTAIDRENIYHLFLGDEFQEFVNQSKTLTATKSDLMF